MAEPKLIKLQITSGAPTDSLVASPSAIPDDTVVVTAGNVILDDGVTAYPYLGGHSDSFGVLTYPNVCRWDILAIDLTQTPPVLEIIEGTPSESPELWYDALLGIPAIPTGRFPLFAINITEDTSVIINSEDIIDIRGFFHNLPTALNTSYTPGTAGDWVVVPTKVTAALNEIASRLHSATTPTAVHPTTASNGGSKYAAPVNHAHNHGDLGGQAAGTIHHDAPEIDVTTVSSDYPQLMDVGAPWEDNNLDMQGITDYLGHRINKNEVLRTWFPDFIVNESNQLGGIRMPGAGTFMSASGATDFGGMSLFTTSDEPHPTACTATEFAYLYIASNADLDDPDSLRIDGQAPVFHYGAWVHPAPVPYYGTNLYAINGIVFHFVGSIPLDAGPEFKACSKIDGLIEFYVPDDIGSIATLPTSGSAGTFGRATLKPVAWGSGTSLATGGNWWGPPSSGGPMLLAVYELSSGTASIYATLDSSTFSIIRVYPTNENSADRSNARWLQPYVRDEVNENFWLTRQGGGTMTNTKFSQAGYKDIGLSS